VALLAELLLAAAAKRWGVRSVGVSSGASGGAIGSVVPFREERRKAREGA
jgi:hypothetical protein